MKAFSVTSKEQIMEKIPKDDLFQRDMYDVYKKIIKERLHSSQCLEKTERKYQKRTARWIHARFNNVMGPEVVKFISIFENAVKESDRSDEQFYIDCLEFFEQEYGQTFDYDICHYNSKEKVEKTFGRKLRTISEKKKIYSATILDFEEEKTCDYEPASISCSNPVFFNDIKFQNISEVINNKVNAMVHYSNCKLRFTEQKRYDKIVKYLEPSVKERYTKAQILVIFSEIAAIRRKKQKKMMNKEKKGRRITEFRDCWNALSEGITTCTQNYLAIAEQELNNKFMDYLVPDKEREEYARQQMQLNMIELLLKNRQMETDE
mmetsp:Transcript_15529/g.17235  ORF Transcript_15529/g.17235 Transcript_15529/m.17235 type:complete len:320 (-) Transcript_15529:48-1007(-)